MIKRDGKKRNRVLRRILLSVITISAGSLTVFSLILYLNFENIALSIIYRSQVDSLNQVSYSETFMTDTAKALAIQVYFDHGISPLLIKNPSDPDINSALKAIRNYELSAPLIDSIYIYNGNTDTFYTSRNLGVYGSGKFFDTGLVTVMHAVGQYAKMKPIPRKKPEWQPSSGNVCNSDVYTYIFYEGNVPQGENPSSAVIINISMNWMGNVISSMDKSSFSDTLIVDDSGNIVMDSNKKKDTTDESAKRYIQAIQAANSETGYFSEIMDKKLYQVIYTSSADMPWKYIRVIPESSLVHEIVNVRNRTIVISLSLMILTAVVLTFASRYTYRPVTAMVEDLARMREEKSADKKILKQKALQEMLLGAQGSVEKYGAGCDELSLDTDGGFVLILLKIDRFKALTEQYESRKITSIRNAICHAAEQCLPEYPRHETVDMYDDKILVLIHTTGEAGDSSEKTALLVKKIQEMIYTATRQTASAFYCLCGDGSSLPAAYSRLAGMSIYKVFLGHGCAVNIGGLESRHSAEYTLPRNLEKEFADSLTAHSYEKAKSVCAEILNGAAQCSHSSFYITMIKVAIILCNTANLIMDGDGAPMNYDITRVVSQLNQEETLEGIQSLFLDILGNMQAAYSSRQNKKHEMIVNKVISLIQEGYDDYNLSIYSLAKAVNMSSGYLGLLFKKSTSVVISDYINKVRIDRAKEMLTATTLSINEIATRVGVANSTYFYPMFRKITGLTPNEYRHNHATKRDLSLGN